jgi:Holliday junction resolvase
MGKFSRDKGYRVENNLRKQALLHEDIEAIRVPLSGGGSIKSDLIVNKTGEDKWNLEVKCRANGFKSIYDWFEGNDGLVIKADNKKALVVLDYDDFLELVARR